MPKSKVENDRFKQLVQNKYGLQSIMTYYPLDLSYVLGKGYTMSDGQIPLWTNWAKNEPRNETGYYAVMSSLGLWITTKNWQTNVVCQQVCSSTNPPTTVTTTVTTTTFQTTTDQTLETTTKLNHTQLLFLSKRNYIDRVMARLENFNKIFKSKIEKFNKSTGSKVTAIDAKPRLIFLMVTDLEQIVKNSQTIVDVYVAIYEKRQKRKHIVSIFKLIATFTLLALGVFMNHTLFRIWISMVFHYRKLKMAKEKRKRRRKRILKEL